MDKIFSKATRDEKSGGVFGFFARLKIAEEGKNCFRKKDSGHNPKKSGAKKLFFGGNKSNDEISNEKNNGNGDFDAKDKRKRTIVDFFGGSFAKSVMVKNRKNTRTEL